MSSIDNRLSLRTLWFFCIGVILGSWITLAQEVSEPTHDPCENTTETQGASNVSPADPPENEPPSTEPDAPCPTPSIPTTTEPKDAPDSPESPDMPGSGPAAKGIENAAMGVAIEVPDAPPPDIPAPNSIVWAHNFEEDIRWFKNTTLGIVLAETSLGIRAVDGISGRLIWQIPICAEPDSVLEVLQTNIVILLEATEVHGPRDAKGNPITFSMAFDSFSGDTLWRNTLTFEGQPMMALPVYAHQGMLLKTIKPPSIGKTVGKSLVKSLTGFGGGAKPEGYAYFLDLMTGQLKWTRDLEDPGKIKHHIYKDRLLELNPERMFALDLNTGQEIWKIKTEDKFAGWEDNVLILAEDEDLKAYNLDATDKKGLKKEYIWKGKTPRKLDDIRDLAIFSGKIFVAADEGFGCMNLERGEEIWSHVLTEKGDPMGLVPSPDGRFAVGTLGRWFGGRLRIVTIDTASGQEIARFPEGYDEKGRPAFMDVSEAFAIRWIDSQNFMIETPSEDRAFRVTENGLETIWRLDSPPPPEFPQDVELAEAVKKKQQRTGAWLALGGLALALAGGDLGSDLGTALMLVGDIALHAGMIALATAEDAGEQIATHFAAIQGEAAFERFRQRQQRINPYIKLELMQAEDGKHHAVRQVDLRTGEIIEQFTFDSPGTLKADAAFSLVFQCPNERRNSLQAIALTGYNRQLVEAFALPPLQGS